MAALRSEVRNLEAQLAEAQGRADAAAAEKQNAAATAAVRLVLGGGGRGEEREGGRGGKQIGSYMGGSYKLFGQAPVVSKH